MTRPMIWIVFRCRIAINVKTTWKILASAFFIKIRRIQCKNIDWQVSWNRPGLFVLTNIDLWSNKVKQHGFKSTVCKALNNSDSEEDPGIASLDVTSTLHSQQPQGKTIHVEEPWFKRVDRSKGLLSLAWASRDSYKRSGCCSIWLSLRCVVIRLRGLREHNFVAHWVWFRSASCSGSLPIYRNRILISLVQSLKGVS